MVKKDSNLNSLMDELKLIRSEITDIRHDITFVKVSQRSHDDQFRLVRSDIKDSEERVKTEVKKYVHEGVDSVVEGIDDLLKEKRYDQRLTKVEAKLALG